MLENPTILVTLREKSNKGHCSQSFTWMSAHFKCGSTLCKRKNVQILSEQTQRYIEWGLDADTDVSLFLSRLAGDSGVKGILVFSLFFLFSSFSSALFHQILSGFPSHHFVSHCHPIFLALLFGVWQLFPSPRSLTSFLHLSLSLVGVMLLSVHCCIKQLALIISWQHREKWSGRSSQH